MATNPFGWVRFQEPLVPKARQAAVFPNLIQMYCVNGDALNPPRFGRPPGSGSTYGKPARGWGAGFAYLAVGKLGCILWSIFLAA